MRSEYITKEERKHLQNNMGNGAWLVFRLMMETGLRVGDAVELRHTNLVHNKDGWSIIKKAQKTGKHGEWKITAALGEALSVRKGYLFPGRKKGSHITRQAVWKRLKKACEEARIDPEGKSPHSMRKMFAVEKAHEEGFQAAQEALQHSNAAVTRIYAYADKMVGLGADEPMRWRDVDIIADYILARMKELDKTVNS